MPEGGGPPKPPRRPSQRPVAVEVAALFLMAGALVGIGQLVGETYVITGSLPAKAPIVGVAFSAYIASLLVGLALRTGRAWFPGLNVAALVAFLYLPASGQPLFLGLVGAHALAVAALVVARPWFVEMSAWRRPRGRAGSIETS